MRTTSGTRMAIACWGVVVVSAAPIVAWWVVGDQSSDGFAEGELDFLVHAPDWADRYSSAAGITSLFALVVAAAALGLLAHKHGLNRGWLAVVALLAAVGVIAGVAARVVTAGVIGANIGAGLSLLIGAPLVAILAASAGRFAWTAIAAEGDDATAA